MKSFLSLAFIGLASLGLIQNAQAEFLIEPLVGWSVSQSLDFSSDKNYASGNGLSYGGRLGFQKLGFQVGLDYLKSDIEMGSDDFTKKVDSTEWAGFVGYKFPFLFRLYAGYIFDAKAESELRRNNLKLEDGTGGKIGLDFTILPFLDLILEYRRGTYDTVKLSGSRSADADFEALMLAVSFPITI